MTFDTDAINNIKFTQGFRGYDTTEVDEFLDDMIRQIEKLNNTIKNLKEDVAKEKRKNQLNQQEIDRLTDMNEKLVTSAEEVKQVEVPVAEPIAEPVVPEPIKQEEPQSLKIKKTATIEDIKGTPEYEEMKQVLTDTLLSAQQHAEVLVRDAQKRADQIFEDGERRVQDRVSILAAEINESKNKLSAINSMVKEAKQRFKIDFQNQITALESITVSDDEPSEKKEEEPIKTEEEPVVPEPKHETQTTIFEKPEKPEEPKKLVIEEPEPKVEFEPEVKEEKPEEPKLQAPEVNAFDFAAVKKSLAKEEIAPAAKPAPPVEKKPEFVQQTPQINPVVNDENDVEDENQQYIEIALSTYNDNKHHNTDYPNSQRTIKINEDDNQGGIYQPENRSVLSSVIEEILNNKKSDE